MQLTAGVVLFCTSLAPLLLRAAQDCHPAHDGGIGPHLQRRAILPAVRVKAERCGTCGGHLGDVFADGARLVWGGIVQVTHAYQYTARNAFHLELDRRGITLAESLAVLHH